MEEINKDFCFKLNEIGDTLAYIVSYVENTEYVYTRVKAYTWGWVRGEGMISNQMYLKGIVKKGREQCYYCINKDQEHIWQLDKVAHLFNSTFGYSESDCDKREKNECYLKIFKDTGFDYLDDFLEVLEVYKYMTTPDDLTQDLINKLAQSFVKRFDNEDQKIKKKV